MNIVHEKNTYSSFDAFLLETKGGATREDLMSLPKFNRALIVSEFLEAQRKERKRIARKKKEWIARARAGFKPGEKMPCQVCGKYQSVAHAHHLTPLHMQYEMPTFSEGFVWLCPTHHEGVHLVLETISGDGWPSLDGFSEEEKEKMLRFAAMGVAQ